MILGSHQASSSSAHPNVSSACDPGLAREAGENAQAGQSASSWLRRLAPFAVGGAALVSVEVLVRRALARQRPQRPVDHPAQLEERARYQANRRLARAVVQALEKHRGPLPPATSPALGQLLGVVGQGIGAALGMRAAIAAGAPSPAEAESSGPNTQPNAPSNSPSSRAPASSPRVTPAAQPTARAPQPTPPKSQSNQPNVPNASSGSTLSANSGLRRKQEPVARSWWAVLKRAASEWWADDVPTLGAALAYYTVFSLAPILIFAIAIAGVALGNDSVRSGLHDQLVNLLGTEGADAIGKLLSDFRHDKASSTLATVLGLVALLFGATGVFGQLQSSLNYIWNVETKSDRRIWGLIRDRFFSFVMVLGVGFLLLVSLVLSTLITGLQGQISRWLPFSGTTVLVINGVVAFLIITLLFAMMFKLLPDVEISWRDVWLGAVVTALLFVGGKYLIGLYLGKSAVHSAYGAAGSIVVILLWAYYSAQILFFGAEFTQVYARAFGSRIKPSQNAVPLDPCK